MAGVEITNLSKAFRSPGGAAIQAVKDLELRVLPGELLALVGPSGCGKTTTLRLIAGLEEPDTGAIAVDGCVLNEVEPRDRGIAMVFQNHALYPHLTVRENLASGLRWRKAARAEIAQRVNEMAVLLGLADCLDRLPEALSGGQRQRAALGRALILRPKLLLLDEPLSNLDPPMRAQMRREIVQLNRRLCMTMIHVTHDQQEALAIGHRIAVMQDGAIQQVATPAELYRRPANRFVAGFIGSPPMNFLPGILVTAGLGLCFQPDQFQPSAGQAPAQFGIDEPMAGKLASHCGRQIVFGIRPEHLQVRASQGAGRSVSTVEAQISVVEPAGAETHLYFNHGPCSIVVRAANDPRHALGQKVELIFDMRQAHFFDAAAGTAIL